MVKSIQYFNEKSHLMDSRFDAISDLRKIIMHKSKKDFNEYVDNVKTYLKEDDVKSAEGIEKGREYILNNWMAWGRGGGSQVPLFLFAAFSQIALR